MRGRPIAASSIDSTGQTKMLCIECRYVSSNFVLLHLASIPSPKPSSNPLLCFPWKSPSKVRSKNFIISCCGALVSCLSLKAMRIKEP